MTVEETLSKRFCGTSQQSVPVVDWNDKLLDAFVDLSWFDKDRHVALAIHFQLFSPLPPCIRLLLNYLLLRIDENDVVKVLRLIKSHRSVSLSITIILILARSQLERRT